MRVDIERVRELHEELYKINSTFIEDLELYRNGERLFVSEGVINKWKYLGLNNENFIAQYY